MIGGIWEILLGGEGAQMVMGFGVVVLGSGRGTHFGWPFGRSGLLGGSGPAGGAGP